MLRFKLFNIPVSIHPIFWLFVIFFTGMYQQVTPYTLILAAVVTIGLLVHEMGHALTARYFGAKPEITLHGFGGVASYSPINITPNQGFLITLNGPLLESTLIGISYFLLKYGTFTGYIHYFLSATLWVNSIWCLINLLPVEPLDGGKLARYLLQRAFGERGIKISIVLGLIAVAIAAPYMFTHGFQFFPFFLAICAFKNIQDLKTGKKETNNFSNFYHGREAFHNGDLQKAKSLLTNLLHVKEKSLKNSAKEQLAKVYMQEGKKEKAYGLLLKSDHEALKEGKCLLCKLAFEKKNYQLVTKYAREIYTIEPTFEVAVIIAKSYAGLKMPNHAQAWLDTAAKFDGITQEKISKIQESSEFRVLLQKQCD